LLTKGKKGADYKQNKTTGLLIKATRDTVAKVVLNRLNGLNTYRGKKVKGEKIIKAQVKNFVDYLRDGKSYRPFIFGY